MKKSIKNTLAVALSVLFVLSCFILPVSAAYPVIDADGGYLAIGDSIGRGCGAVGSYLDQNDKPIKIGKDENDQPIYAKLDEDGILQNSAKPAGQYDKYYMRNVKGAYPTLVAEALGCNMPYFMDDQSGNFWPLCYPGLTSAIVLDLMGVDDNFSDEKLDYPYYKDLLEYFGYADSFNGVKDDDTTEYVESLPYISDQGKKDADDATGKYGYGGAIGKCGSIKDLVEKASIITVEIGMCDVFYRTYRIASKGGMLSDGAEFDLSSPEAIGTLGLTAVTEIFNGMMNIWKRDYPLMIETLQQWNPNAKIVLVGSFNVVKQLTISDKIPVPLGNLFNTITNEMNKCYEDWAKKYGDNVLYADISATDPLAVEKNWSLTGDFMDNTFAGTHPSQYGYNYITRQILNTLDPDKEVSEDLVIDLIKYKDVASVTIDGKKIDAENYSMDGYKLVVKNVGTYAKNLTITVNNGDGSTATLIYQLKYSKDTGYTSERLYSTSNTEQTKKSFLEMLKMLFQKIVDFFKGLFK